MKGRVFVASALNDMYSKGGNSDEAQCVLDQTSKKNNVLYHGLCSMWVRFRGCEIF